MSTIVTRSGKGAALTHGEVDANFTNLNADKAATVDVILATQKGAASGVCPLDATSKVASTYLPSYVDDVLEYANLAALPVTGETGKIYVALDTNKTYRWSGSAYIYITSGAVDSVAGRTGAVVLTSTDVGLANANNTSDANKPVSTATQTALDLKSPLASPTFTGTTTATNLAYTGTLTGGTGVVAIGTNQIYKDASGNVGIGTSSPACKLHVYGGAGTAIAIQSSVGSQWRIGDAIGAANGTLVTYDYTNSQHVWDYASGAAGYHTLYTAGLARMQIDSSGNVGIGTSSPSTYGKLAVVGGNFYTSQAASPSGWAATTNANSNAGSYYFQLYTGGGTNVGQHSCNSSGEYLISTYSTTALLLGTNSTERMRIDSSGNVGIGTTAPNNKLTVGAPNTNGGSICVASFSGANVVNLNTSGMVVITPTDSIAADIGGSIGFAANGTIMYPTGTIAGRRENATANNYASYMQFSTCNSGGTVSEKMRIDSSGNVGIGTSSPAYPLDVVAESGTAVGARVRGRASDNIGVISFYSNDGVTRQAIIRSAPADTRIVTTTTSPLLLGVNSVEAMRIDSSGNVGIGVAPSTILHVKSATPQFRLETTGAVTTGGAAYNSIADSTSSQVWVNGFAGLANCYQFTTNFTNGFMRFMTGVQVEAMRIDSSGNVGIGTSSPNASAILDAQSTTKGVRFPNMTTTQKTAVATPAAGLVVFDTTLAKLCVYSGAAWQTITSV